MAQLHWQHSSESETYAANDSTYLKYSQGVKDYFDSKSIKNQWWVIPNEGQTWNVSSYSLRNFVQMAQVAGWGGRCPRA